MIIIDNNTHDRPLLSVVCRTEMFSKGNLSTADHVDFMVKKVTF
jgi:hypothetical protein